MDIRLFTSTFLRVDVLELWTSFYLAPWRLSVLLCIWCIGFFSQRWTLCYHLLD